MIREVLLSIADRHGGMLQRMIKTGLNRFEQSPKIPALKLESGEAIAGRAEFERTGILKSHAFSTMDSFPQTVGGLLEKISLGKA